MPLAPHHQLPLPPPPTKIKTKKKSFSARATSMTWLYHWAAGAQHLLSMPPPTATHQLRSASRSMNRRKRVHMSKESLTLNMPLLHLLSSQPVVHGLGKEAITFYKRLTSLLADQWDQPYSITMNWLRCTLSFCLLWSSHSWCTLLDWSICQSSFISWSGTCGDELSVFLNFYPVTFPFLLHCTIP